MRGVRGWVWVWVWVWVGGGGGGGREDDYNLHGATRLSPERFLDEDGHR